MHLETVHTNTCHCVKITLCSLLKSFTKVERVAECTQMSTVRENKYSDGFVSVI